MHLTFNALYYIPEQYPKLRKIIRQCMELGFQSYILADPALICYLRREHIDCEIHLSGENAEVNSRMFSVFQRQKIRRLIFHRKNSFDDMKRVVQAGHGEEFEAFVLNELCHFTGAFCNSLHCDEMGYLCRVPYRLGAGKGRCMYGGSKWKCIGGAEQLLYDEDGYLCGFTGCGLCAPVPASAGGHHPSEISWPGKLHGLYGTRHPKSAKALEIWNSPIRRGISEKKKQTLIFESGAAAIAITGSE